MPTQHETVSDLAIAVDSLVAELHVVIQALDELREEFSWAVRNNRILASPTAPNSTSPSRPSETPTISDRAIKRGYSADHVVHEILTTEFLLALWQSTHGNPNAELLTVQRRSLERHSAFQITMGGRPTRLKPDAMFMIRQSGGMIFCFLEIDTGSMSTKQLKAKFRRYAAWAESTSGQRFVTDWYRRFGAVDARPAFRVLTTT